MEDLIKRLDQMIEICSNLEDDGHYKYNNISVPRVSNILNDTISKNYLINWAANIGKAYYFQSKKALNTGTLAHKWIEEFLLEKKKSQCYNFSEDVIKDADISYCNFVNWYMKFSSIYGKPTVIKIEERLSCPYYGGTADCIMNMNGSNVLVDFKTSKQIDYSYIMQLAAYKFIIDNYRPDLPHIDAIGIIRVPKDRGNSFQDLFLNESIAEQKYIIDKATEAILIAVQHFYSIHKLDDILSDYEHEYNIKNVFTIKEK